MNRRPRSTSAYGVALLCPELGGRATPPGQRRTDIRSNLGLVSWLLLQAVEAGRLLSFGDRVRLDVDAGLTVVTGPNGAGKTNLGLCLDLRQAVIGSREQTMAARGCQRADRINGRSRPARPTRSCTSLPRKAHTWPPQTALSTTSPMARHTPQTIPTAWLPLPGTASVGQALPRRSADWPRQCRLHRAAGQGRTRRIPRRPLTGIHARHQPGSGDRTRPGLTDRGGRQLARR